MPFTRVRRVTAGLVIFMAGVAVAPPAVAAPMDKIPGNGVFQVGNDIAPGLYHTNGPSNPLIIVVGNMSSITSCTWFTHSKPAANRDDVISTNSSLGPMYVMVSTKVAAFETTDCQPWTRVNQAG
jgi:hypothetical protein